MLDKFNTETKTIGWQPSCGCDAGDPVRATVLDPFFGAGTTGIITDRLNRDCIGIELSEPYLLMAKKRLRKVGGLFSKVVISMARPTLKPDIATGVG